MIPVDAGLDDRRREYREALVDEYKEQFDDAGDDEVNEERLYSIQRLVDAKFPIPERLKMPELPQPVSALIKIISEDL